MEEPRHDSRSFKSGAWDLRREDRRKSPAPITFPDRREDNDRRDDADRLLAALLWKSEHEIGEIKPVDNSNKWN